MKKLPLLLLLIPMLSLAAPKFTGGDCSFCEYTFPNGQMYSGSWKNGKQHGTGTNTWPNGQMYSGSWKNGKFDGAGTMTLADGQMYVGSFKNNKRHGTGTNTWPDGKKYAGSWKNDKPFENSIQQAQEEAKAQYNQQLEMQSIQQAQEAANAHFAEIQRQNAAAQRRYQAELANYRRELAAAEKARERARKDAASDAMIELGLGIASGKYEGRGNSYRAPTIVAPSPPPMNPYSRYRMTLPDNSYIDCTYNSQTRNANCY